MKLSIYHIDAFANKVFSGNPAAVCPLTHWLPDDVLQAIAMENNLPETAFFVQESGSCRIRWFTPTIEVDLCGHATLAAAFVLFGVMDYPGKEIVFHSRSGELRVSRDRDLLTLDFPADSIQAIDVSPEMTAAFDVRPLEAYRGRTDFMFVFGTEADIQNIVPNLQAIAKLNARGVIVTAKGDSVDFVSRFFAPQSGINEDPVTGSAHTTLTPYWAEKLGKKDLSAVQLSARRGELQCSHRGDRVQISGQARTYLRGEIEIE